MEYKDEYEKIQAGEITVPEEYKLDPELKAKWVAALRSGNFAQGSAQLKRGYLDEPTYCCLGVLCEVTIPESSGWRSSGYIGNYFVKKIGLPESWQSEDNTCNFKDAEPQRVLAMMNDRCDYHTDEKGKVSNNQFVNDFNAVADFIETYY